jgi:hypothetical protein
MEPMADLSNIIERIRQVIDDHAQDHGDRDAGTACGCGATRLSDHSRHLAEAIVEQLRLRPESVSDVSKRIRYVSALFDDELTKLEGAE